MRVLRAARCSRWVACRLTHPDRSGHRYPITPDVVREFAARREIARRKQQGPQMEARRDVRVGRVRYRLPRRGPIREIVHQHSDIVVAATFGITARPRAEQQNVVDMSGQRAFDGTAERAEPPSRRQGQDLIHGAAG